MGPALLEVLNTHLPMGSRELMPWFALCVCAGSVFPIKLNLSPSMSSPDFALLIPSLIPLWGAS